MHSRNSTVAILWRGRLLILISLVAAVAVAYVATSLATRVYAATAIIQVQSDLPSTTGDVLGLQQASQGLATTYATLIGSPSFLARIQPRIANGRYTTGNLVASVSAQAVTSGAQSTNLIQVSATATSATQARSLANDVARAFVLTVADDVAARSAQQQAQLQARVEALSTRIRNVQASGSAASSAEELASLRAARAALTTQLATLIANGVTRGGSVTVVAPAEQPGAPIRPRRMLNLVLGVLLGGLLGVGAAWLRHLLDRHVESSREAEHLVDVPVLGTIPLRRSLASDDPIVQEAYSVLHTNVGFLALDARLQVLTVTSYEAGEGKSSVTEGLGRAAVRAGRRVLLIDGDVRTGALSRRLGHESVEGLTNLVARGTSDVSARTLASIGGRPRTQAAASEPILRLMPGLSFLPAGATPPNAASLLASNGLRDLVESFRASYDLVLIDSPPVSHLADASLLAAVSDGSLVVARAGQTRKAALPLAIASLRHGPSPVVGLVVFEPRSVDPYYYPASERNGRMRVSRLTQVP